MPAAKPDAQARRRALAAAMVAFQHSERLLARASEECALAGVTFSELTGEIDDVCRQLRGMRVTVAELS